MNNDILNNDILNNDILILDDVQPILEPELKHNRGRPLGSKTNGILDLDQRLRILSKIAKSDDAKYSEIISAISLMTQLLNDKMADNNDNLRKCMLVIQEDSNARSTVTTTTTTTTPESSPGLSTNNALARTEPPSSDNEFNIKFQIKKESENEVEVEDPDLNTGYYGTCCIRGDK